MAIFQSREALVENNVPREQEREQVQFRSGDLSKISDSELRKTLTTLYRIESESGGLYPGEAALKNRIEDELDQRWNQRAEEVQAKQDKLLDETRGTSFARDVVGQGREQAGWQQDRSSYQSPRAMQENARAWGQSAVWGAMLAAASPAAAGALVAGAVTLGALYAAKGIISAAAAERRQVGLSSRGTDHRSLQTTLRDEQRALKVEKAANRRLRGEAQKLARAEQAAIKGIEKRFGKLDEQDRAAIKEASTILGKATEEYTSRRSELMRGFAAEAQQAGGAHNVSDERWTQFKQDMHAAEARLGNVRSTLNARIEYHQERITDRVAVLETARGQPSEDLRQARQEIREMVMSFKPRGAEPFKAEWYEKAQGAHAERAEAEKTAAPAAERVGTDMPRDERTPEQKAARMQAAGQMWEDVRTLLGAKSRDAAPEEAKEAAVEPKAAGQASSVEAAQPGPQAEQSAQGETKPSASSDQPTDAKPPKAGGGSSVSVEDVMEREQVAEAAQGGAREPVAEDSRSVEASEEAPAHGVETTLPEDRETAGPEISAESRAESGRAEATQIETSGVEASTEPAEVMPEQAVEVDRADDGAIEVQTGDGEAVVLADSGATGEEREAGETEERGTEAAPAQETGHDGGEAEGQGELVEAAEPEADVVEAQVGEGEAVELADGEAAGEEREAGDEKETAPAEEADNGLEAGGEERAADETEDRGEAAPAQEMGQSAGEAEGHSEEVGAEPEVQGGPQDELETDQAVGVQVEPDQGVAKPSVRTADEEADEQTADVQADHAQQSAQGLRAEPASQAEPPLDLDEFRKQRFDQLAEDLRKDGCEVTVMSSDDFIAQHSGQRHDQSQGRSSGAGLDR